MKLEENYNGIFKSIITSPPYYRCRKYGDHIREIGRESTIQEYLDQLTLVFKMCLNYLSDDGTLWIVINDIRKNGAKQNIPHRLAMQLQDNGYNYIDDIVWYKRNHLANGSKSNFAQAYEHILLFSKSMTSSVYNVIKSMERYAGIFEVATKAHYGQEHYAIFPEELISIILNFATREGDYVLDPFAGRGTTGLVCAKAGRSFMGIELYEHHIKSAKHNLDKAAIEYNNTLDKYSKFLVVEKY
jgi:site-specific DNA-methyltransferase (adenine-specific)